MSIGGTPEVVGWLVNRVAASLLSDLGFAPDRRQLTTLGSVTQAAFRAAVEAAPGGGSLTRDEVDGITAILDQLWHELSSRDERPDQSLLERLMGTAADMMAAASTPVEGLGTAAPVSTLSVLQRDYGVAIDPEKFKLDFVYHWQRGVRTAAVRNPGLTTLAAELRDELALVAESAPQEPELIGLQRLSERLQSGSPQPVVEVVSAPKTPSRVERLTNDQAAAAVGAFEPSFQSLENLTQNGQIPAWDEEFIQNTIQQIVLWRQRDDADPRIFELLMADLVKRLLAPLTDPEPLRRELLRLGADEATAADASGRVVSAVAATTELGHTSPTTDGLVLEQLATSMERIAESLESLAPALTKGEKSLARRAADGAVIAGAGTIGKAASDVLLAQLRRVLIEEWPRLQIGLVMAWHAAKQFFSRYI